MKSSFLLRSLALMALTAMVQICPPPAAGQDLALPDSFPDFRITHNNQPDEAYLFMFIRPQQTKSPGWLVIMDNEGTPVFYRYLPHQSGNFELHSNGMLSFSKPLDNKNTMYYMVDSSYRQVDSVTMTDYPIDSHDFRILENGNYLMFALDIQITDMSSIVEGGDPNASVAGVVIREVDRDKNTVFEWNSWDHMDITDSYADLTRSSIDLLHPNSLDVDEDGNILLISRTLDEVTTISRKTGMIMHRMGGKKNEFSFADSSHRFSRPHDFRFLGDGHYTIFDNGTNRDPAYTRAVEYLIDTAARTAELVWEYDAGKKIFSKSGGSARRLPSGNTILCYGGQMNSPSLIEVHPDGSKAFELHFDDVSAGRGLKFPWKTNLFEPASSSVNFGIWDGYSESYYLLKIINNSTQALKLTGYSLHSEAFSIQESFPLEIQPEDDTVLTLVYYPWSINSGYISDKLTINSDISSDNLVQRIAIQVKLWGYKEDKDAPTLHLPINRAVNVPEDTVFYIQYSEAIRMLGGRKLNYENVDSIIDFRKNSADGETVAFNAVINTALDLITVVPDSVLLESQVYYLSVSDLVEDYSGNQANAASAFFSTGDSVETGVSGAETLEISVYPNPGNGIYQVILPAGNHELSVFSIRGQLLLRERTQAGRHSLDLSRLPGNVFILRISNGSSALPFIHKIIKQ